MKLVLAAAIVLGVIVARRLYVQWQVRQQAAASPVRFRRVPPELLDGADRTWLVFTTRSGRNGAAVQDELARHDAGARVVTLDARREPHLAEALEVRASPTAVLADRRGDVQAHLVGAAAVRNYLADRSETA